MFAEVLILDCGLVLLLPLLCILECTSTFNFADTLVVVELVSLSKVSTTTCGWTTISALLEK